MNGVLLAISQSAFGEAFIFSDVMTSLRELAIALKEQYPRAYVPVLIPAAMAEFNALIAELVSQYVTKSTPLVARDHLRFIIQGYEPLPEKARQVLSWAPMSLQKGVSLFLERYDAYIN